MKWMEPVTGEILVLGLGTDVRGDAAVGLHAARALRGRATGGTVVAESSGAGLALLDLLEGYEGAIILDAVATGRHPPGTVLEFDPGDGGAMPAASPRCAGLPEALRLARQLGVPFPRDIRVVAVEIEPRHVVMEGLSPAVAASVPEVVERVTDTLKEWQKRP